MSSPITDRLFQLLKEVGLNRREAKTLIYLLGTADKPVTSQDIQNGMNLKQTETSLATRALRDRGWITISPIVEDRPGHRTNLYQIAITEQDLIEDLDKMLDSKVENIRSIREGMHKAIRAMTPAKPAPAES
jgi:predicted transcriptional regulator